MNHTFEMFDICFVYIVIIINLSVKHAVYLLAAFQLNYGVVVTYCKIWMQPNCEQAAYHC